MKVDKLKTELNDRESHEEVEAGNYVVLGGTGGIGSCVSSLLLEQGANVMVSGRDRARLSQFESGSVHTHVFDETDPNSIDNCISETMEQHGRIDGVVNCIGSVLLKPAHRTTDEEWQSIIDVNLTSSFKVLRSAVCGMMSTGGSIVLVSSAAALSGMASHEAIAAAKAGVIGMCRSAAASYARRGIRVNCVAPGLVQTQMTRDILSNERSRQASESMHAMGRLGTPEDIANAIVWLLSPKSSWVTGQVLGVDGGLANLKTKAR